MKLLNKNKKRPYFANFIFEPEQLLRNSSLKNDGDTAI